MIKVSTLLTRYPAFTMYAIVGLAFHAAAADGAIEIIPGQNAEVIYDNKATISRSSFSVHSHIPVSVLRYNDQKYLYGETPISRGEAYIYVKTNCPSTFDDDSFQLKYIKDDDGLTTKLRLNSSPKSKKSKLKRNGFLEASSFSAKWHYTSYWCKRRQSTSRTSKTSKSSKTSRTSEESRSGDDNSRRRLSHSSVTRSSKGSSKAKCKVNLEILIDGCSNAAFDIKAPTVQIIEVQLMDETKTENVNDECTTDYEALLTFPGRPDRLPPSEEAVEIARLSDDECSRAVEGRPFIDSDRNQLQAMPAYVNAEHASWATGTLQADNCSTEDSNATTESYADEDVAKDVESTWTKRALGEHSSVASFAAFTLSLMTNGAPPSLVRDSLLAALDEVDHATTSFEVASLFGGRAVGPGPLPPSSHEFGHDMKSLALGAAREGCIDETLSALAAAAEADSHLEYPSTGGETGGLSASDASLLGDKLTRIALDEARHSALAWRTVQWACNVDDDACEAVKGTVFDPTNLAGAVGKRFPSGKLQKEWNELYKALVPIVLSNEGSEALHCDGGSTDDEDEILTVTQKIVKKIIRGVICD